MKPTTFEAAWKSGEIDEGFIEDKMCPVCRKMFANEIMGREMSGSSCEGSFCDKVYDEVMEGAFE
ncbi:hypothetical protein AGMMS49975_05940 [Clostridia bacterium]|nr:hypothetical protein AGMMS49975_05940 [Clostridia bacterium]